MKKQTEKIKQGEKEEKEIVIDAQGMVLGRLASFAAKKALQGKKIIIINSEKAIITGRPKDILSKYLKKTELGRGVQKGPIILRAPEEIARRAIRGMVGRKKTRGREAFRKIKCYKGMPEDYTKKEIEKIQISKKTPLNFITLEELSKLIK